jgi:hypothetical protein
VLGSLSLESLTACKRSRFGHKQSVEWLIYEKKSQKHSQIAQKALSKASGELENTVVEHSRRWKSLGFSAQTEMDRRTVGAIITTVL